jgi:putative glycerol-1-phosphate prenyltransferase
LGKFRSSDFKIKQSPATHIFIGGSLVETNIIDELIIRLKHKVKLPMVLFPEIHRRFLRSRCHFVSFLISGRNYLIGYQVKAAPILKRTQLEIIPTGYIFRKRK